MVVDIDGAAMFRAKVMICPMNGILIIFCTFRNVSTAENPRIMLSLT